jgi:hypothetical protein
MPSTVGRHPGGVPARAAALLRYHPALFRVRGSDGVEQLTRAARVGGGRAGRRRRRRDWRPRAERRRAGGETARARGLPGAGGPAAVPRDADAGRRRAHVARQPRPRRACPPARACTSTGPTRACAASLSSCRG